MLRRSSSLITANVTTCQWVRVSFSFCMRDFSSFGVVLTDHDKTSLRASESGCLSTLYAWYFLVWRRLHWPRQTSQGVSVSVYWVGVESKNKSSAADFVAIMLLLLRPFLLINWKLKISDAESVPRWSTRRSIYHDQRHCEPISESLSLLLLMLLYSRFSHVLEWCPSMVCLAFAPMHIGIGVIMFHVPNMQV
jgi:hypothetical protein